MSFINAEREIALLSLAGLAQGAL